jgi:hypothetical protein
MTTGNRLLGAGLVVLAAAVAAVATLGPLVFDVLRYRVAPPNYLDAMRDHPGTVQYLSSPTAFWLVKFMDLGIVVPAAIAVGVGALRRRPWARKPVYALLGGSTLIATLLAAVTGYAYRPLLRRAHTDPRPAPIHFEASTV